MAYLMGLIVCMVQWYAILRFISNQTQNVSSYALFIIYYFMSSIFYKNTKAQGCGSPPHAEILALPWGDLVQTFNPLKTFADYVADSLNLHCA